MHCATDVCLSSASAGHFASCPPTVPAIGRHLVHPPQHDSRVTAAAATPRSARPATLSPPPSSPLHRCLTSTCTPGHSRSPGLTRMEVVTAQAPHSTITCQNSVQNVMGGLTGGCGRRHAAAAGRGLRSRPRSCGCCASSDEWGRHTRSHPPRPDPAPHPPPPALFHTPRRLQAQGCAAAAGAPLATSGG